MDQLNTEDSSVASSDTPSSSVLPSTRPPECNPFDTHIDDREQLFNEGLVGKIEEISRPETEITSLRGILFDLDLHHFRSSALMPTVPQSSEEFYKHVLEECLSREPVLENAEVRQTGSGIHVIPFFDPVIQFRSAAARDRWKCKVGLIQGALPIDPDQPLIAASTRPVGSTNGKHGRKVKLLREGRPIEENLANDLADRMQRTPFSTLFRIMTGDDAMMPCPFCNKDGSRLAALDRIGRCYGSCGNVPLKQLYDAFLVERSQDTGGTRS